MFISDHLINLNSFSVDFLGFLSVQLYHLQKVLGFFSPRLFFTSCYYLTELLGLSRTLFYHSCDKKPLSLVLSFQRNTSVYFKIKFEAVVDIR